MTFQHTCDNPTWHLIPETNRPPLNRVGKKRRADFREAKKGSFHLLSALRKSVDGRGRQPNTRGTSPTDLTACCLLWPFPIACCFMIAHRFSVQLFALIVVVCGGLYVQKDGETDFFVWHRSIIISA